VTQNQRERHGDWSVTDRRRRRQRRRRRRKKKTKT
jgi:hypothetical protein